MQGVFFPQVVGKRQKEQEEEEGRHEARMRGDEERGE